MMSTELIKVTINGQEFRGRQRRASDRRVPRKRVRHSVVLLLQGPRAAGVVPHVPGAHREDAEAANLVHDHLHGRHDRHDAERRDRKSPACDGRISARQSPARLSGLRPRRRMRAAGSDLSTGAMSKSVSPKRKNAQPEKYLSPIVANDPQRCILCKRCTRVCDEWMGEDAIEAGNRGVNTVIGTYGGWLNCSQCGNCIEVCPTGTLLDGVYRHETRPWELEQTIRPTLTARTACRFSIGSRGGRGASHRRPRPLCQRPERRISRRKGRFGHGFINHRRPHQDAADPLLKRRQADSRDLGRRRSNLLPRRLAGMPDVGRRHRQSAADERIDLYAEDVLRRSRRDRQFRHLGPSRACRPFFDNLSVPLATHKDIRHAKTIF